MLIVIGSILVLLVTGATVWFTVRATLPNAVAAVLMVLFEVLCIAFLTISFAAKAYLPGAGVLVALAEIVMAIVVTIVAIAKYGEARYRWGRGVLVLGIFFVVFCGDVVVGKIVFHSLCAYEGGTTISKTAENVGGFVDAEYPLGCSGVCMEQLGQLHYRFVEQEVLQSSPERLAPTRGKYKFSLKQRGAAECSLYEQLLAKRASSYAASIGPRYGIPVTSCVASIRIQEFEAPYIYKNVESTIPIGLFRIFRQERIIADRVTGEVLGKTVYFRAAGGWVGWVLDSQSNGQQCYDQERYTLLTEVLKPAN